MKVNNKRHRAPKQAASSKDDGGFDLVAYASSGKWNVWIDETPTGPERVFVQLEGPVAYFSFELSSIAVVDEIWRFLTEGNSSNGTGTADDAGRHLDIGGRKGMPVSLVCDGERGERFILKFGNHRSPVVHYCLQNEELLDLTKALGKVRQELEEDSRF